MRRNTFFNQVAKSIVSTAYERVPGIGMMDRGRSREDECAAEGKQAVYEIQCCPYV